MIFSLEDVGRRSRNARKIPGSSGEVATSSGNSLGAFLYLAGEANRRASCDSLALRGSAPRWALPADLTDQLVHDPLAWFERERAALVSGVRQAARAGQADLSWNLAFSALPLLVNRDYFDDWRDSHEVAPQAGDVRGQVVMLYSQSELHFAQQHYDQARGEASAALRLFQDISDEHGAALAITGIACADRVSGRLDDAARRFDRALGVFRSTGHHLAAGFALVNIAEIKLQRSELDEAGQLLSEALGLARVAPVRKTRGTGAPPHGRGGPAGR